MVKASIISCGVYEIAGLHRPPNNIFKEIKNVFPTRLPAIIIFSDITETARTKDFINCIKNNQLGYVEESEAVYNVNSGNRIKLYYWVTNLNWETFKEN